MDVSKCTPGPVITAEQLTANAELIAEALNVAARTGKSPQQLADWSAKATSVLDRARTWLIDNIDCQCEPGFHCRACALLSDIVRLQAAKPTETIETPK